MSWNAFVALQNPVRSFPELGVHYSLSYHAIRSKIGKFVNLHVVGKTDKSDVGSSNLIKNTLTLGPSVSPRKEKRAYNTLYETTSGTRHNSLGVKCKGQRY